MTAAPFVLRTTIDTLSEALGVDRMKTTWQGGAATSLALRRRGLVAATYGSTVHVDDAVAMTGPVTARAVLAHEMVHVLQQTEGARWIRRGDSPPEMEAEARLLGCLAGRGRPLPARRADGDPLPPRIQGHDSFEHRLLGDTPTNLLTALVGGQGGDRDAGLASACALLDYLGSSPTAIDPAKVNTLAGFPVRLVTLTGSHLAVTYGELNMMADFLTSPDEIDELSSSILLPILQMTRHDGWERLNAMRTHPASQPGFTSWLEPFCPGSVDAILETEEINSLTQGLGTGGRDHYKGTLARNACHFAPYSWWRWQASYNVAAAAAQRAYSSGGDAELVRQAWVAHGYADHFLQDSFAAGHLVNKTLVMQWFLEWAAPTGPGWLMPVYNFDAFKTLTAGNQPGLANLALYDPGFSGLSNDPQTTEEQPTSAARMTNTGVVAAAGLSQDQAYQAYLAWLDSPVCQIVSGELHDVLNGRSVMASSDTASEFQIWGDDTLLTGGTGAGLASATAQLSQQSIQEILAKGGTDTTWQQIFAAFPSKVLSNGSYVSLPQWHARGGELWNLCRSNKVFDSKETWAFGGGSYLMPTMGVVSIDQSSTAVAAMTVETGGSGVGSGSVPFSNDDCGKATGVSRSQVGALRPGDMVTINGSTDLSSCIVGNSGARVYSITLAKQAPILYTYVITVEAAGPQGASSGWLRLYFTDRTGDQYALAIFSSQKAQHTVAYNSADPGIVKIEWGD